jgi:cytoskeletal protein RodZ
MTARHNIRIGNRRLGKERATIDATPAPRVGEMLQNARELKGVDLFRAERDTKIRLKYLAALEDSEYDALPPLVYTKGFLRNYAIYLGLDPEDVITRWRDETQLPGRKQERPTVAPPPQPLAAPRRGVAITPGLLVAFLFSLVVIAVFAWIGWQLLRFADVPKLALTSPPSLVSTIDAESVVLTGTSGARAEITIITPDGRRMTVLADENGAWSREVDLAKGRNDFQIIATDAVTHRQSPAVSLIVNVPLPGVSPGVTTGPTPGPITLSVGSPGNGVTLNNGKITVRGTTSGTRVTITSTYLGPVDPLPTLAPGTTATPTAAPTDTPEPTPTLEPGATPAPTAVPEPTMTGVFDLTVDATGTFSQLVDLPAGRWQLTITSSAAGVAAVTETRNVIVKPAVASGLTITFTATGGDSWMRVILDGVVKKAGTWGGPILKKGESLTVTAVNEIYLRTGNADVLSVTVNGQPVTISGTVSNWIFKPGLPPEQTSESR